MAAGPKEEHFHSRHKVPVVDAGRSEVYEVCRHPTTAVGQSPAFPTTLHFLSDLVGRGSCLERVQASSAVV